MIDLYKFVWGVVKYLLPAMLFIISVLIAPDLLLLIVSLLWIFASVIETVLTMPKESGTSIETRY
ncbi:MAG: hypothetical protein ACP5OC_06495 [Thermoplasmata archaeon]